MNYSNQRPDTLLALDSYTVLTNPSTKQFKILWHAAFYKLCSFCSYDSNL